VHDRVRPQLEQQPGEPVVLGGQVNVDEPISRPETSRHALIRSPITAIGVSESTSRSISIFRRLRLSRMVMS